jgi:hypothetical protein
MARKITIQGVEFEVEQRGVYVHWGVDGKPDVMVSQQDKNDFDCHIHQPGTGEVLDQKEYCTTKDAAVAWAKAKGHI